MCVTPTRFVLLSLLLATACDGVDPPDAGSLPDAAGRIDGSARDAGGDSGVDALAAPARLEAVGAAGAVGLSWEEVSAAESYDLYWSTSPGVTPDTGEAVVGVEPGFVHEGLTDGTAYHYVVTAVSGSRESAPSPEATATPGGELELVRLGGGTIDAVDTPWELFVPLERRVHVIVLAEGYLDSELDQFRSDVQDWLGEVFALDPYSAFSGAFVVWALPRASAEHVAAADPQTADTAFLVPLTSDGRGISSDVPRTGPTSERVWQVVDAFGLRPTAFYPSGGSTSLQAKTLLAHILVLDPMRGRSGLSGRARRLENPSDADEVVSVAIAHGRAHELSHAFARLADEYLDDGHSSNGADVTRAGESPYVSNVVDSASCATLPWQHLLVGGVINPDTDGLVGAFGNPQSGYHSELRCLMNGTHDNAATYGGDGRLRSGDRFCNYCRELVVLRLFERTQILSPEDSMAVWTATYREPYYALYDFQVPDVVPQTSSDGTPWFTECTP